MRDKDEEIRNTIRCNLIALRNEKGLTQTEVGNIVGKGKNTVGSWEQGLSLPDVQTLYYLAKFYGKSLSYMYGEDNEKEE